MKHHKVGFVKWQKAWSNRIKHYTPREKPDYDLVPVDGIIEKWDTKIAKGTPQIKTIKISPMFGADVVRQYKAANEAHPPGTAVKSEESAEKLRAVVGLDIRFMVGCDQAWEFSDDEEAQSSAAGPAPQPAVLTPAAPNDDAAAAPSPPVDSSDFTKWNVLDLKSIPLPEEKYDAGDFRARRSGHAALLLCYMSPEMEDAFPDQAQALYAGYQELYQRPVTVEDVRRYPTVGPNAYTAEEASWCDATYTFLEGQLDDAERAKRMLPAKKRTTGRRAAPPAAAPPRRLRRRPGERPVHQVKGHPPSKTMTWRMRRRNLSSSRVRRREDAKPGRRF